MLSLLSVGGAVSVLPEMHRSLVDVHGWMSSREFSDLFALAQAAPGPNVLVVSLFGWQAAGMAGAVVTTLAMILPSSLLTYYADRLLWRRAGAAGWREIIDNGLAPITVGLVLASGVLLAGANISNIPAMACTAAAALIAWRTRVHPLWLIAAGALAGIAGIV
ncbi:MAG: chromate transporter [Proteobacteria bacterium]|nr:chromate transporter [Pseudomonadota bacterium]